MTRKLTQKLRPKANWNFEMEASFSLPNLKKIGYLKYKIQMRIKIRCINCKREEIIEYAIFVNNQWMCICGCRQGEIVN